MDTKDKSVVQKEELFKSLVSQLELVILSGSVSGVAMITPKSVKRIVDGAWGVMCGRVKMPNPRKLQPRAKFVFTLQDGVNSLYKQGKWTHVYAGGITFPETEKSQGDYIVLEVSSRKSSRTYVDQSKNNDFAESMDKDDRIMTALTSNRYWYAIPTDAYSLLAISNSEEELFMTVTDREYARKLVEVNNPKKSKWLSKKDQKLDLVGWIVMVTSFLPTFFVGWLFELLKFGDWKLAALITLGITMGISIYLLMKADRGEPI